MYFMIQFSLWIFFALVIPVLTMNLPIWLNAVNPTTGNSTLPNSSQIHAGLILKATNETVNAVLSPAVNSLLNLGPFVFKISDKDQIVMKTKIDNQVNNVTQNVEGTSSAYAVVGIELGKALKTVSTSNDSQSVTVNVTTSCKSMTVVLTSCNNVVQIKPT